MYAKRINSRNQRWGSVFLPHKHWTRANCQDHACYRPFSHTAKVGAHPSNVTFIKRCLVDSLSSQGIGSGIYFSGIGRPIAYLNNSQLRSFSSEGDGRNTSEDKQASVKDADNGKTGRQVAKEEAVQSDTHAQLAEQDQKEWLKNEKLAIESKKKESPFLTRRERFKNDILRRIVPWDRIHVSWETFPYYINEHTKSVLVECVASHIKHKKFTAAYGARLRSSSGRILLQSIPGTELYRERIVKALARDLHVPLLVLDSSVLAPYDFGDDCSSECESDDNSESGEECASESEIEDANDAGNEEEWTSSAEAKSDCSDDDVVDVQATAEAALKKLIPYNLEEFEKRISGESDSSPETSKSEAAEPSDTSKRPLKKGDRVKYVGPSIRIEADDRIILGKIPTLDGLKNAYTIVRGRPLSSGQRGEIYEVNGDRVAVILDITSDKKENGEKDDKLKEQSAKPPVYWIDVKDIEHDPDTEAEECYIAMEALCEVLHFTQPLIVYFQDSSLWLSRAVPKSNRRDFIQKVHKMFDQISGPVVLICGQNKVETGSKEKENLTMILPSFGRLAKLPLSLKNLTEGLRVTKRSDDNQINKLFTNILSIHAPKEEDLLKTFNKQIEEDRRIVISRSNLNELYKVLEDNEMSCVDLLHLNTDGVILTKQSPENKFISGFILHTCYKNEVYIVYTCLLESLKIVMFTINWGKRRVS